MSSEKMEPFAFLLSYSRPDYYMLQIPQLVSKALVNGQFYLEYSRKNLELPAHPC